MLLMEYKFAPPRPGRFLLPHKASYCEVFLGGNKESLETFQRFLKTFLTSSNTVKTYDVLHMKKTSKLILYRFNGPLAGHTNLKIIPSDDGFILHADDKEYKDLNQDLTSCINNFDADTGYHTHTDFFNYDHWHWRDIPEIIGRLTIGCLDGCKQDGVRHI